MMLSPADIPPGTPVHSDRIDAPLVVIRLEPNGVQAICSWREDGDTTTYSGLFNLSDLTLTAPTQESP